MIFDPCAIRRKVWLVAFVALALVSTFARAGANLVAIGNYDSVPFTRAEGRISAAGKEIVYSFVDPRLDFGRIVVRSTQPLSVIRRDLFVGFTGSALVVDSRTGRQGAAANLEVEFWLRIDGALRGGHKYAWEVQHVSTEERIEQGIPAIIPMFWADGQQIASEVNVVTPESADSDRIQRLQVPHGVVELPNFESQSGAAWIVLKPQRWGQMIGFTTVSFREDDKTLSAEGPTGMPIPVRYTPIRSVLEGQLSEVFDRSVSVLKSQQNPEGFWGDQPNEAAVQLTSAIAGTLALFEPKSDEVKKAQDWLGEQSAPEGQNWSVPTVTARLAALSTSQRAPDFLTTLRRDVVFLTEAQLPDGGWGERSQVESTGVALIVSSHFVSINALAALADARVAGVEADPKVWRNALQYWTDAQSYGGGFSDRTPRFGGVGQGTTSGYTAIGAAGLLTAVDMAFAMNGRRCNGYTAASKQLRGIDAALAWLEEGYGVQFRDYATFREGGLRLTLLEPGGMIIIGLVSGISEFNEKELFRESAADLLRHYDQQTAMFGIRGAENAFTTPPNLLITATALGWLAAGNAPAICQRIVAGDDEKGWAQYRSDAAHLARYLGRQRGVVYNWRRVTIDDEVRKLVEVPILVLNVVGDFEWTQEQWRKLREYCLAGGSVVVDIDPEAEAHRSKIIAALEQTFSEYKIADLPADASVLSVGDTKVQLKGVKALGNGFRHFLFLPPESWSCIWHLYDTTGAPQAFGFMDNLLTYVTDESPPRNAFADSTYAIPAASSRRMKATRLQVGAAVPAFPNLIETMSRLMQSNYRLEVLDADKPADSDLIWLNVAGEPASGDAAFAEALASIRAGKFVFIDIVSGNQQWDEAFRAELRAADPKIVIESSPRTAPIFTGMIPGTQGFDAVEVHLRKALQTRFSKSGRCDLYTIMYDGRQVGVYSAHDISSGIGFHYFPGCRGPMPEEARKIAMNAFLLAYARTLGERSSQ